MNIARVNIEFFTGCKKIIKSRTKKTLTRKQHKKDNSAKYNKTRVCIGDEYDRWTELKDVLQIKTHAEDAKILLGW
jgi:hypothetical protein